MSPAWLIAGPTAAGKTALAIAAAQRLNGEIINADSMQVYAGLHLITARPSAEEEALVPHHLFGVADPAERWSVGRWSEAALALITDIHARGRTPILVGGTGLYFHALTVGLAPVPEIGEAARAQTAAIEAEGGLEALRQKPESLDPVATARAQPRPRQRPIRIVAGRLATGQPPSPPHPDVVPHLAPRH